MRYGSEIDPQNRFERVHLQLDDDLPGKARPTEYLFDDSKSIVAENRSPDLPFRYSINPYRGCAHGCSYCYARPTHEYLGFNAGLDFETKIVVKRKAPELFRDFLAKRAWQPELISMSGVTDCYQPAERQFELTRKCLQVALDARQPIGLITKNALLERDLDLLASLASHQLIHVYLSITTLDSSLAREMEPRTSTPQARLRSISSLAEANVPVGVMIAPVIPGLTDDETPAILESARAAGASAASYVMLRLPLTVRPVFEEWLQRTQPLRAERVLGRVRQVRHGRINESEWGQRLVGTGPLATGYREMFELFAKQLGLGQPLPEYDFSQFRRPRPANGQGYLF